MKTTAIELLKNAESVLHESRDARREWLAYRRSLVRSEVVKNSLTEVDAAVEQALDSHAAMLEALTALESALAVLSQGAADGGPPENAGTGPLDRMLIESKARADAAFGVTLDMARVRVAQECGRLASVLAPGDSPRLISLIDSLARNGADVVANFTLIGNFIAVAKAAQRAFDDIANHASKPLPADIIVADGWFGLADLLKGQLAECDRWNALVAAELTYWRRFMQSPVPFGTSGE